MADGDHPGLEAIASPKNASQSHQNASKIQPMEPKPLRFIGGKIEVRFDTPPLRQKTPPCPDGFDWQGHSYQVDEMLAEWKDFTRRGRMARNMQPAHAAAAAEHGSLGVGRFYFRVRVDTGQVFDLYYDREIKDVDDRLGHWFLYREMSLPSLPDTTVK
jgi:hypothetical protein